MQHGWLTKTHGGRTIEHIPCPNPGGTVDESAPPTGVVHTIEGDLNSGLGVFRTHYAPHFTLDGERIIQLVPLGTMAAALENHPGGVETNSITRVQIEVAGHSKEEPWMFDGPTSEAFADLLATLATAAEIPLERPFPDEMPAKPWATYDFARRSAGKWGHVAGWYGHVEVPENAHWDPGALKWSEILERAKAAAGNGRSEQNAHPKQETPPKPLPDWYWHWLSWQLGEGDFKQYGAHSAAHRPADAPAKIPAWAWVKAGQFTADRKEPHGG
jgi:hypothetical protein